jgi:hypothetical protein
MFPQLGCHANARITPSLAFCRCHGGIDCGGVEFESCHIRKARTPVIEDQMVVGSIKRSVPSDLMIGHKAIHLHMRSRGEELAI